MDGARLIQTIRLENILSFGHETISFPLEPLNVLIGPNASGKSNLIDALSILQASTTNIQFPFREGGGAFEWHWKGLTRNPNSIVELTVHSRRKPIPLRYRLSFSGMPWGLTIKSESVEDERPGRPGEELETYYRLLQGKSVSSVQDNQTGKRHFVEESDVKRDQSILSQRKDPMSYPELSYLVSTFQGMHFYRDFPLGRNAPVRQPQQADLPQHNLEEDASNLAVIVSYLQNDPQVRKLIQECMQEFFPSVKHIHSRLLGGTAQIFFEEEGLNSNVPATRLSDGCLRYLCLLVALHSPMTPTVICIEEPETGLHPDSIPKLAELLVEASTRSQIFVTTHSDILVDALSDTPEAVVICEKVDGATQLRRLDPAELKVWLEKYRLGELWTSGELGGNLY